MNDTRSSQDILSINADRFLKSLEALAQIGRSPERPGLSRRALSPETLRAKGWLTAELDAAHIPWREDGAGNIIARYGEGEGAVATGSHLDTVPCGGHLDGALGVVAGLEALRCLSERGVQLKRPVELIAFTDEEGRFGSMIGSKCMTGTIDREALLDARDDDGRSLSEALGEYGLSVESALSARRNSSEVYCFVELHIEQGPVLDTSSIELGVVEEIVGIIRWRARFGGEANHAGTTPMHLRRDAFVGLTRFASALPLLLEEHGSPAARGTIGEVELKPGYMGVVPSAALFSLDLRDISQPHLERLNRALQDHAQAVAMEQGLTLDVQMIGQLNATACDPRISEVIAGVAEAMDTTHLRLPSGATHDALPMSSLCPMGMIFVPSVGGVSHSPKEHTEPHHSALGAQALLNTLYQLAQGSHCVDIS